MKVLTEEKAEKLLSKYLPVAKSICARKIDDAVKFAEKSGYPAVLKIISKQALHKTDVKGVRIVNDESSLRDNFNGLVSLAKKKKFVLDGILVQEHISGTELIIGIKKDPAFGHVLMFGVGGIFVEALKDISFRVCPISQKDAESMINDIKAKKVLSGLRGAKPVNMKLLKDILVKASRIPEKYPQITELDINPFIINDKAGKVADARIILD